MDNIQYLEYNLIDNKLRRKVTHYFFSSDPSIWVPWNAQDEFGQPPQEAIDEDAIKADKISEIKFFGEELVNIKMTVSSNGYSQYYQTQTMGRNLQ